MFVDDLWLFLVRRGASSVHDVHRKPDHLDLDDDYLDDVNDKKLIMIINLMHLMLMAIMLTNILIMKLILVS